LTALATDPTEVCSDNGWVCRQTYDWWENETVSRAADNVIGGGTAIVIILVIGFVIRLFLHRMIDRLVRKAETGVLPDRVGRVSLGHSKASDTAPPRDLATATRRVQRAQAMGSLLKSIVTGIVLAIVITMVLAEVGINVGPIIASAGIIGVALGFGAQSLVGDLLSGTFMIFEDL
jgi:small conductance mechanosensitive channel